MHTDQLSAQRSSTDALNDAQKQLTLTAPSSKLYDPNLSTEENYRSDFLEFIGSYVEARKLLDYSFHKNYVPERQILQDQLMDLFLTTRIYDSKWGRVCEIPNEKWFQIEML